MTRPTVDITVDAYDAPTHHEMAQTGPGPGSRVTVRSPEMSIALSDVIECHIVTATDSAFSAQWK